MSLILMRNMVYRPKHCEKPELMNDLEENDLAEEGGKNSTTLSVEVSALR